MADKLQLPPPGVMIPEINTPDHTLGFFRELVSREDSRFQELSPIPRGTKYSVLKGADSRVISAYPELYFLKETVPIGSNTVAGMTQGDFVIWNWSTSPDAEDVFNAEISYLGDSVLNSVFARISTIRRDVYEATPFLAIGSSLTALLGVKITAGGTGYSTATATLGGPGSGAEIQFVIANGVIIRAIVTKEGTGYTSSSTISITGDGSGATAQLIIQPAGAILTSQKKVELPDGDPYSHDYVKVLRVYEVLPGPWIPFARWDDNLGPVQGIRRAVLISDPPQSATSDVGFKQVFEARDGSSVVAMEMLETWGSDPYAKRFEIQIDDPTPEKFQSDNPTQTTTQIEPGRPSMPTLGQDEWWRVSEEVNKFWRRVGVRRHESGQYPRELDDYLLGGVQTHGSEFGGTLQIKNRLHNQPQSVEEGFDILASRVDALGRGLTWRRTTRLFNGGRGLGPYIELLTGGEAYVDDPAVVFSSGSVGSGAAGTASITQTPIAPGEVDPGGTFTQTWASDGDGNGVFTFIGKRYNGGVWRNPATAGNISITAKTHPSYPLTQERLNTLADHSSTGPSVSVVPQAGGGHYIMIDLGVGRTLKANKISFQLNAAGGQIQHNARVFGFNVFGVTPANIGNSIALPQTTGGWTHGTLDDTNGYRYFWVVGLDAVLQANPEIWPILTIGEIELYGELTIAPAVELGYLFDGDENGVFRYLGALGNGGTWRNPHTNGDIEITAGSGDTLALGTLDSIVDREPSNTYFVDHDQAEVHFDLKGNRSLLLETVSFRQRANYGSSMTQVKIQGSNDGSIWEEFQLLTVSPTANAWTKVNVTAFTKYYRYFRLILPSGKSFLSIGELELYGTLRLNTAGSGEEPGYSVTGVLVTNQGSGYAAPPQVMFSGGGPGSGAAARAILLDDKVVRVDMISAGSGYTSAPDVAFVVVEAGSGAELEAEIAAGVVTAINVVDGGSGYTEVPTVKIVSATGTGATAHAVLTAGVISSVVVDTGGSGYARVPTVVAYPPTDPEADAEIGFGIASIEVVNGGSGYSSPPTPHIDGDGTLPAKAVSVLGFAVESVVITDPGENYLTPGVSFGGDGTGAAGTAVVGKAVASTTVTAGGSGYASEPEVEVDGDGEDAQFRALIGRALLRIDVAAQGSGYTSNPTVGITGDGSGAAAHVVRSFGVASIAVSAGGSGYSATAPDVAITAPTGINGRQATAHAVISGGAVTSIVIDDAGFGYLTAPTATLSGGDGTGATAGSVTLESGGAIDNIVLDTAGSNYSAPPVISFTGGSGSGAEASAILNTSVAGAIVKLAILNAGSGYTVAPSLTIVAGTSGGTGATATATLATAGGIKAITITDGGSGYTSPPPIIFHTAETHTYVSDGDTNGVFYRLGTNFGAVAWTNPHTAGRLTVSCIEENNGTMAEVVDRVSSEVFTTNTNPDPWFKFDLGSGVSLICNHASYRQRTAGGGSNTTGFDLQGSNDNSTWTTLATQSGISTAGNTWRSFAVTPTIAYRYFRIIMTGVTNFFTIGEFELYGDLFHGVGGGGSGAEAVAVLAPTGSVKSVSVLEPGEGYRAGAAVDFFGGGGSGATGIVVAGTCGRVIRVVLTKPGGPFTVPPDVIFVGGQSGGCGLEDDGPVEQEFIVHGSGGTYNGFQNLATVPVRVLINPGDVPDGTYTLDYTSPDTTTGFSVTITVAGGEVTNCRVSYGLGHVDYPGPDCFFAEDGYILDASNISISFNFLGPAVFERSGGTAPIRFAPKITLIRSNHYTDGITANQEVTSPILYVILGEPPESATAAYRLGNGFPTLIEEQTDATEKIVIHIEKTIVPARSPLPAGYSEIFPLDIYRSIQIVSRVNLDTLPAPDIYKTTQNVAFPKTLLRIYPIWDKAHDESTQGGLATGTQRGSVSAGVQVIGNIVVLKTDGFRGAANAFVERQFFFGPPPDALVPLPTIIRPSTGTASIVATRQSKSRSGLTYSADGSSDPNGDFASFARSSSSSGASTQVVDINDVLNPGIQALSGFNAQNSSFADALNVQVSAFGIFRIDLPASTPFSLVPGQSILAQVGVEKWRFGLYVRTLVKVIVPELP